MTARTSRVTHDAYNAADALASVALGDLDELPSLIGLRARVNASIDAVALAMRASGRSWVEIGEALGMTKQGAQKRYGRSTS